MKNRCDRPVTYRTMLIIGLFLIALFIAGSGISCQSPAPAPPAPGPGSLKEPTMGVAPATPPQIEVAIEGFAFKPAEITVPVGSTVTWHNNDSSVHTVTARDKSLDSGNLSNGDTFSYTFMEKGTFEYYCTHHPYMTGKVTVE